VSPKKSLRFLLPIILLTLLVSSCGVSADGIYVWIDVPLDGLSFPEVQAVNIEGHASGAGGVSRVELYVNGDLWTMIEDPPANGTLASFQTEWIPPAPGLYTIHAVAYGPDGATSQFDETRISIGEITPTPVITVTPVPEEPITPGAPITPAVPITPAAPSIQFWAEPETIDAGECSTIHWQVENVKQVIFGGVEQPFVGSYQVCLCENQRYSLIVIDLDEVDEKQSLDITVTGTCATEDTTPPPAPAQAVPGNGLSIGCKGFQNLVWIPVDDESGIGEYQVNVQRHSGDNNWQEVPGSVFSGIHDKQLNIAVECGWAYRWQVRAVDGEGNTGSWSSWWQFTIVLE